MAVDPITQPMPVQPTAHYAMGGIPTNLRAEVLADEAGTVFPGLYAAGEVACVSVHGSNRLGTNSLLDIIVFGKVAGERAAAYAQATEFPALPPDPEGMVRGQLESLKGGDGTENAATLRQEMQVSMMEEVGVFRTAEGMQRAVDKMRELKDRFARVRVQDTGKIFNTDLLEAWELGCMLDISEATAVASLNRTESRGAHAREDFTERDDENWLRHSMAFLREDGIEMRYKPVTITKWQPEARVY